MVNQDELLAKEQIMRPHLESLENVMTLKPLVIQVVRPNI